MLMHKSNYTADELTHKIFLELAKKQKKYGDSMEYPMRGFSDASIIEQLNLKIDDKLCIVYNSKKIIKDQVYLDIICYILLYKTIKDTQVCPESKRSKITSMLSILVMTPIVTIVLWLLIINALSVNSKTSLVAIISVFVVFIAICFMFNDNMENKK